MRVPMAVRRLLAVVFLILATPFAASAQIEVDAVERSPREIKEAAQGSPGKPLTVAGKEALEILMEAAAVPTVAGRGKVPELAGLLAERYRRAGFAAEDVSFTPMGETGYFTARYRGSDPAAAPLLLVSHLDVVDAKREDWDRDPFVPVVEDGWVKGRGVIDAKSGVAHITAAVFALKRVGFVPSRDVVVAFTGDEETDMASTRALVHAYPDAWMMLNEDGLNGVLDSEGNPVVYVIGTAEKTYADFRLVVTDPGGHSSRPTATNALVTMSEALARIGNHRFPVELSETNRRFFLAMAQNAPQDLANALQALATDPTDEVAAARISQEPTYLGNIRTTCVPTMIEGGHAPNALPQSVTANVNCRILPGHSIEETRLKLMEVAAADNVSITTIDDGSSVATDEMPMRSDLTRAVRLAVDKLHPGAVISPYMSVGAGDSMHFKAAGIPSYSISGVWANPDDTFMHGLNEKFPVAAIDPAVKYWQDVLQELLGDHEPSPVARIEADTAYLASDDLAGREPGTQGYDKAADYVAQRFAEAGLEPAAGDGEWMQPVPLSVRRVDGPGALSVTDGATRTTLDYGTDFFDFLTFDDPGATVSGEVVFAGRCIADPVLGIDDFAGLDVRSKIVACIGNTHGVADNDVAAFLSGSAVQHEMAASRGALGVVRIVSEQQRQRAYWANLRRHSMAGQYSLAQIDGGGRGALAWLSASGAEKLFAGSVMAWDDVLAADRAGDVAATGELGVSLTIAAGTATDTPIASSNVIGLVPGSDPALRDEYVVLTAHLDHLGTAASDGAGDDGDRVMHGAIDNAAGVAMLIEAARLFVQAPERPRQSVVFAALTAEESGLLGSRALIGSPPFLASGRIVANVNIDNTILSFPYSDMVAFGGDRSSISDALAAAYAEQGIARADDPWAAQAIFTRSDHFSFVQGGIPAVMLQTGPGGAGKDELEAFLATRYHTPADDMSQPILWDEAARFAELNYLIARHIADADEAPRWVPGDYFGERFAPGDTGR